MCCIHTHTHRQAYEQGSLTDMLRAHTYEHSHTRKHTHTHAQAYERGNDEQQKFVQNLALFFTGFLKAHIGVLEQTSEDQVCVSSPVLTAGCHSYGCLCVL